MRPWKHLVFQGLFLFLSKAENASWQPEIFRDFSKKAELTSNQWREGAQYWMTDAY